MNTRFVVVKITRVVERRRRVLWRCGTAVLWCPPLIRSVKITSLHAVRQDNMILADKAACANKGLPRAIKILVQGGERLSVL
ncbi:hypothetical protein J6590_062956 [Homalodisca vitripennis]|nr:hypothetical protein J6590_062956 [Homalodisca vitripennis]